MDKLFTIKMQLRVNSNINNFWKVWFGGRGAWRLKKVQPPSRKSCSTAAAEGPQRVVVMKLKWNCDDMDATFFHLKAELCLTAAIYAVVNQVCGNHRWEITASVIGKSIKRHDHFKQVSAGLWGVLQGDWRGIALIHSLIDLMSCGNRQRKIWEYIWGSD